MTTKDELKRELTKLIVRNHEILELKSDPKYKVITSESAREYQKLDEEHQTNHKKMVNLILQMSVTNIAKTWGDLEKQMPTPLPICVVGTTPEVSQQITPQPSAGSTVVAKRQWLNKVMDKTAAEGFELDGYTVSVGFSPRVDLHYKRKSQ